MTRKKIITSIVGALAAYLFFLIIYLPASQVVNRLLSQWQVTGSGFSGTIWSGHADQLVIRGVQLNNVNWQLKALPLILAKVSVQLKAGNVRDQQDIALSGQLTLQKNTLKSQGLTLYIPAERAQALSNINLPVAISGRTKIELAQANVAFDGQCSSFEGQSEWLNATIQSDLGQFALGNFSANLSCEEAHININVKEPNLLGLSGSAIHQRGLQFSLKGRLKPDSNLPANLRSAVQYLGNADNQGYIHFAF